MSDQWLSIVEYAREYSVSDMTVRRRIKTGRLHAVLKEGKYYIPKKAESISDSTPRETIDLRGAAAVQTRTPLAQTELPQSMNRMVLPRATGNRVYGANHTPLPTPASPTPQQNQVELNRLASAIESTLLKLRDMERVLEENFHSRIALVEANGARLLETIKAKDIEVATLRQQNEDLLMLVKILEEESHLP